MRVGWVGLGAMGAPMAARAARAGHVVRGYDVTPGRAASLATDGVQPAGTAAAAADGADLTVIMVATPEQMEQALFAPGGAAGTLAAGSVLMVMATVGPEAVVSAAGRLARTSRWRGLRRCCRRWLAALRWSAPPPATGSGCREGHGTRWRGRGTGREPGAAGRRRPRALRPWPQPGPGPPRRLRAD